MILILGLLAAVVLPRLGGTGAYGDRASANRLVSGLRYAQQQALSRNRLVRVELGQPSLARFRIHVCDAVAGSPGGCTSWSAISPPTTDQPNWGLAGGARFAGSTTLYFDRLGRSVTAGGAVSANRPVALDSGASITVIGETGFARRS